MNKFSRYRNKDHGLMFSAFSVFMIVFAAKSMFPLDLGDGPLWTKIYGVLFLICWYGLLVVFVLYGLSWLQTIEIDREEIRVYFGSFVVRRISTRRIKSVGMAVQYNKSDIYLTELVLSEEDRYALNERGEKYLKRSRVRSRMSRAGVSTEGRDAAARACLFESRKGILLRMEWTEEAEAALRERLATTTFVL